MRVKFKDRRQFESCWVKDISNGGIFLRTQTPAALFGRLTVVLELPNGDSVELIGEVVRVVAQQEAGSGVAAGMGVQFVDLSADKRALLEAYLGHTMPIAVPDGLEALSELLGPPAPGSVGAGGGARGAGARPAPSGGARPEPSGGARPAPSGGARPEPSGASAPSAPSAARASAPTVVPRAPVDLHTLTGTSASSVAGMAASSSSTAATVPLSRRAPPARGPGPPPAAVGVEDMVHGLRRLVWLSADSAALADADFYEILGVSPSASVTQIVDACAVLRALLDPQEPPPGLRAASSARALDLCRLLDEIEHTLQDGARRARYDGMRRRR